MNAWNVYKCEEEVKIVLLEMARLVGMTVSSLSPPVIIFVRVRSPEFQFSYRGHGATPLGNSALGFFSLPHGPPDTGSGSTYWRLRLLPSRSPTSSLLGGCPRTASTTGGEEVYK